MKSLKVSTSSGLISSCFLLTCALTIGLAAGCGGGEEPPAEDAAPMAEPEASAESTGEAQAVTGIAGKVSYDGPTPKVVKLDIAADPVCEEMHGSEPLYSDREVVSADGGVQWAFVYVKNPPAGDSAVPEDHVVLDQIGCTYVPHVLGMRAGQVLDITSSDDTRHNIRSFPDRKGGNKSFNISLDKGKIRERAKSFLNPEMAVKLKCDIHPWMTGYVFSMDHPYFAVSDETGNYAIGGLPAGEYTVVVWHETYGEQETTVTVTEGSVAEAGFTFSVTE